LRDGGTRDILECDLFKFMAKLFDLPRYIAVEGPIRVGKSTLSTILAERLNAQRVTDPEQNSFLGAFYDGKPGAAFQAQFTFLVRRFEQLQALDLGARSQKVVVSDFIFEKDKIFACLNLNDQELDTYNRYYNYFREQLPTLLIYLQATPEVLKKRLKKKNAAAEKAISEEYLEEVIKAYEHFFFHYTSSDLLIVNTSEIDFVERNEDLQELLRKVSEPIKGTQYFLPLGSQEAASA
jgi:deoxyguanosine kinase